MNKLEYYQDEKTGLTLWRVISPTGDTIANSTVGFANKELAEKSWQAVKYRTSVKKWK